MQRATMTFFIHEAKGYQDFFFFIHAKSRYHIFSSMKLRVTESLGGAMRAEGGGAFCYLVVGH
jgi:hypothetical protein